VEQKKTAVSVMSGSCSNGLLGGGGAGVGLIQGEKWEDPEGLYYLCRKAGARPKFGVGGALRDGGTRTTPKRDIKRRKKACCRKLHVGHQRLESSNLVGCLRFLRGPEKGVGTTEEKG